MPRLIDALNQLSRIDSLLNDNPEKTFRVATHLSLPTYRSLLQSCADTGRPVAHQVEESLADYYRTKRGDDLDPATRKALGILADMWGLPFEQVVRKLLEKLALKAVDDELQARLRLEQYVDRTP